MQDISLIPIWDPQNILAELEKNPLDQKALKAKLEKLYQISSYNQLEYVGEVVQAYAWIKLAHQRQDFNRYFANEKIQKWFLEEFVATAIRYMIICRKFKNLVMMVLTQQMIIQALKLYVKKFDILDKYPKTNSILRNSLQFDKQFYKLNYINDYPLLTSPPSEEDITKMDEFINSLKPGDKIDMLKSDSHSKRFCWLPGTVKKLSNLSVYAVSDFDKSNSSVDRKSMHIYPYQTMKQHYYWRNQLDVGSQIDYQDSKSCWIKAKITQKRQDQDSEQKYVEIQIEWQDQSEWISLGDVRMQKLGTFTNDNYNISRGVAQSYLDDFNDVLIDPQMNSISVFRFQYSRSILLNQFINFAHKQLNLFQMILKAVQNKKFGIEVTADLVGCISTLHPLLHRKFAMTYLTQLSKALIQYVTKADEQTIRNFSKERFELVSSALTQFLKRVSPASQRKLLLQQLQLSLTIRFLQSDFLDRKLYAISVLTSLLKQSKHRILKRNSEELMQWVKQKNVLSLLYNEKSHSELISRSFEFLQYYLYSQPNSQELAPLLQWSEPILKLLNQCYEHLPEDFKEKLILKIKQKVNVTNKDALDIIKRTNGCQKWLLDNGGESWVSVVKQKTKRKEFIVQVFEYPFAVVEKITKEISQLYQCRFKTEFFLQLHDANYLPKVLKDDSLPFLQRVQFAAIAIQTSSQIKQQLFQALAPYTQRMDQLPSQAQLFFVGLLPKLHYKNIFSLFQNNYSELQNLSKLGLGQFSFFKASFLRINQQKRFIDKKITSIYNTPHSYKKQKRQILTIKANPNQLIGIKELMTIIFQNKDLKVTQSGLEFIGFLFDHLAPQLQSSVVQFRASFLENCLTQLYSSKDHQEKYLRIIGGLLDQSQKQGIDPEPSVNSLFVSQNLTIRVIDHFNVNKSRMIMEISANLTLHELKAQIARQINAYPNQFKLLLGDKELNPRLNGRVIHTLALSSSDLIVEKKVTVEKVNLCESDGSLNEKCKIVLKNMFKQYSQGGLMSKQQCQKYHQRCVGQVSTMSQNKVDKIYEQYDTDKDGYLTQADFFSFYQYSAKVRQSAVWANFETFGIRNDLQDLRELQIAYPESQSLVRHLLFNNQDFMKLLISFLQSDDQLLVQQAWKIASRLPLLSQDTFFSLNIDTSKNMLFRYWLYEVVASQKWQLLTSDILQRILSTDIQTSCIGLRAAIHSPNFQVQTFSRILTNLKKINAHSNLSFHTQIVLDNTLRILQWLLRQNNVIREYYTKNHTDYSVILTSGLLSKNSIVRKMYCEIIETIIIESSQNHFQIFEPFFKLVYNTFEKCDKTTLSIEYFDLYSQLLQVLKLHPVLLTKLQLNWLILTRGMINLFLNHKSTQLGLNSPPDQVAQGFLKIIRKLLEPATINQLVPLVKYLFQHSLFPESGQNKLKNSKSRKEAYELLYQICSIQNQKGQSPGLQQLFAAGFKSVYKKMSANKNATSSYSFSSYFYNYNEARSQLGYAGIRNLGCICYMLAMLQQLFMTKTFRSLILMADDGQPQCLTKRGSKQIDDNIFHQLQIMFANLQLTQKQDFNPDQFCFSFKDFQGMPVNVSIQQDAQQFLNLFFDKLQTALKPTPFRRILEDTFGGKTCNQTICSNCKAINQRFEPFYPLSLEIKGYKNIEDSFKKFIQGEVISDYQCDSCKKKTDVTKSCLLAKVPNNFIIHLQRMCFNYDKFQNQKVNSRWEFPLNLNVYNYTHDKQKNIGNPEDYEFSLKGVVLHYGSAEFGHYFSYIKQTQSKWIQFNDERVRQFDPHDIQIDCFGGQHWRRQSQSAYLLVYEKIKKTQLHLQFDTQQEKINTITKFNLQDVIYKLPQQIQSKQDQKLQDEEETLLKVDNSQKQEETQQPKVQKVQNKVQEVKKIILELIPQGIPSFIPTHLKEKISKTNEEFSFTLNLSNDQFAHFLHKILSIDPPGNLNTQFLELCYECFHLRTMIEEDEVISLSQWAAKRFKQIIGGYGWQFLKVFGQNWQTDILSIEKNTRIGIKNLLQCVITDIIQSAEKQKSVEKEALVKGFLQKYTDMLAGQVCKNWTRFKQYFQVWISLINESSLVREWCTEVRMVQKLLDFILQQYSPFSKGHKKYSLRNMHYGAQFQHPLEVLTILLKQGHVLTETERNCMRHYAFLEKVIKYPTSHFSIVQFLCKDDRVISQKFAYITLMETSKVSQSDQVKPIIASIHCFIDIKDKYQQNRIDWLIGYPQYVQNLRTNSYGIYGINPDQQTIINYVSPVRAQPLTQQLIKFKHKAQHVAALLLSCLLQLQLDGYIENLDSFPSVHAFFNPYTFWFEEYVDAYYEESHRSFIAKHYTQYGNRLKSLWTNRPNRKFDTHPFYLIGRTQERHQSKKTQTSQVLQVQTYDIQSSLLEINEENHFINKKNVKNYQGSQNFRVKLTTSYGSSSYLNIDRNQSSDEEETQEKGPNPFLKAFNGKLLRKIIIKNLTYESLLIVAKISSPSPVSNFFPNNFELSFEIKGNGTYSITLAKHNVEQPFGQYKLQLKAIGPVTQEGYWPRQIITQVQDQGQSVEQNTEEKQSQEGFQTNTWVL